MQLWVGIHEAVSARDCQSPLAALEVLSPSRPLPAYVLLAQATNVKTKEVSLHC
jgi:hypothetical protein